MERLARIGEPFALAVHPDAGLERYGIGLDHRNAGDFGAMQGVRKERCQGDVTDEQRSITPKAPRRAAVARKAMKVVQHGPVALSRPR